MLTLVTVRAVYCANTSNSKGLCIVLTLVTVKGCFVLTLVTERDLCCANPSNSGRLCLTFIVTD